MTTLRWGSWFSSFLFSRSMVFCSITKRTTWMNVATWLTAKVRQWVPKCTLPPSRVGVRLKSHLLHPFSMVRADKTTSCTITGLIAPPILRLALACRHCKACTNDRIWNKSSTSSRLPIWPARLLYLCRREKVLLCAFGDIFWNEVQTCTEWFEAFNLNVVLLFWARNIIFYPSCHCRRSGGGFFIVPVSW